MKQKYLLGLLALILFSFFSFKPSIVADKQEEMIVEKEGNFEMRYAPSGSFYELTFTKDTITDAEADTLYLPSRLRPVLSDFQASVSVTRTSISGTHNVAVKVQESNYAYTSSTVPPSAGWVATLNSANAAAATAATTATTEGFFLPHLYGINYRTILIGTGTQSSSYVIRWVFKKKT